MIKSTSNPLNCVDMNISYLFFKIMCQCCLRLIAKTCIENTKNYV